MELLQTKEGENFGEQLARLAALDNPNGAVTTYIFLAVKLLEERVTDICPLEDWEKDLLHYRKMAEDLRVYNIKWYREGKQNYAIFLSDKLLMQLEENMDLSRNYNKTAKE